MWLLTVVWIHLADKHSEVPIIVADKHRQVPAIEADKQRQVPIIAADNHRQEPIIVERSDSEADDEEMDDYYENHMAWPTRSS